MFSTAKRALRTAFEILNYGFVREWLEPRPDAHAIWMAAAQACGVENLVSKRQFFMGPWRFEGARPPLTVTITSMASRLANAVIAVRGVPGHIRLKHESLRTQASKLAGARDVELGDPEFDAEFFLDGEPFALHALFDAETRALARSVFGGRPSVGRELFSDDDIGEIGIHQGKLVARFVDTGFPHPPVTPAELLHDALDLAERLVDRGLEQRLLQTVRADALSGVRIAALSALHAERPQHPATREALRAACGDLDSHVRLAAAIALGGEGRPTLVELASRVRGPDDVSARAVAELRSHLPAERARAILSDALRSRRLGTAAACIDSLSRSGPHADVIARVLALETGALGLAAARALGRCGTLADVAFLREVEARHSKDAEMPQACRAAIAAIHARQPDASPGQLSLTAEQSGQVTLVRDEAGRLSIDGRDREE